MLSVNNENKLFTIVNTASKINSSKFINLTALNGWAVQKKGCIIMAVTVQLPLHSCFEQLPSLRRYRCPRRKIARFKKGFVLHAIDL